MTTDISFESLDKPPFNDSNEAKAMIQSIKDFRGKWGDDAEMMEDLMTVAEKGFDAGVFAARNCT